MKHDWDDYDRYDWIARRPSRRLRKLYAELAAIELAMDAVRTSNPVPEHAPSSYQIIRKRLQRWDVEYARVITAINKLQNQEE